MPAPRIVLDTNVFVSALLGKGPSTRLYEAFKLLRKHALIVRPKEQVRLCRDPEDNFILECALAGQADWIITGDNDLLALHPFRGIHIVPPSTFFKHLSP